MGDQQKVAHGKRIRPEGVSVRKGREFNINGPSWVKGRRTIMESIEIEYQRYTQVYSNSSNIYYLKESKRLLNEFKQDGDIMRCEL